ncbi:uncharacterized protein F4812DRAFT_413372 [Daldinia caldariorum]|uniref:uncharacterized protein n=1 Tax=Daldinia caldariorum TaxID=326644 RepID=UPI00200778E7|nr:uncharacterized protein F4812DRAFT_413372 [Daldinia caldariorum]KAI1471277.1 hypothetical protein F4812DRAFT_413372 [Daldinia caldariorum]
MLCRENDRRYTVPHDVDRRLFGFSPEASKYGHDDITRKLRTAMIESPIPGTPVDRVRYTALLETCRQVYDPRVANDFLLWLYVFEVYEAVGSVERITVLFQEDICGMSEEFVEDVCEAAGRYLIYNEEHPRYTVDVGFFPSLRYAFDNFSGSYP